MNTASLAMAADTAAALQHPSSLAAQLNVERYQGVSTAWKSVFDAAHDGHSSTGPGSRDLRSGHESPSGHADHPRAGGEEGDAQESRRSSEREAGAFSEGASFGVGKAAVVATASKSPVASIGPKADALFESIDAVPAAPLPAVVKSRFGADTGAEMPASDESETEPRTAATAMATPPDENTESVSVFVHGDSRVTVVVRDAELSDLQAVRSAFETARQLTGQGNALRQLTLNGRAVYRQDDDVVPAAGPTMTFAC